MLKKYCPKINIYEIEHKTVSNISSTGFGTPEEKQSRETFFTEYPEADGKRKVITWIAGSSNSGRDHRNGVLQVCTGSGNSTSKLNWISHIFEYHLHTS